MKTYVEESHTLPVIDQTDVIIVGGGPAGVAAAVTAGELGLDVVIIEKNGFFGGSNVAGYSGTIGGLYSSGLKPVEELDQIVHGFAGRFVEELKNRKGIIPRVTFGHTALAPHDPYIWKDVADQMVSKAGVKILFHTIFVDAIQDNGRIEGIIIENKNGRQVILGKTFIDASGDGDISYKAGVPYSYGNNGVVQAMTMVFRLGNVDWEKAKGLTLEFVAEKVIEAEATGKYKLPRKHPFVFPAPISTQAIMNCTAIVADDLRVLYPTKAEDLTYAELNGRQQIKEYARFARNYLPGFKDSHIIDTAAQIGIRQGRTIEGIYTLTNEDVVKARKFDTAIARSAWPIEIHGGAQGVKVVNLNDDYYEIPYEVMLPKSVDNLLVAGRCISAEHEALASARVVAQCFEEGMAAALASYLSLRGGITPKDVDRRVLRNMMMERGSSL